MNKVAETPLMKQYNSVKERYPDAILLFRVGDFYETFCADAIKTSKILNITLTRRANGTASSIELAGFPFHSLETYLPRLVRAGERVAICEQLEDPKLTKKIVKRDVTELITPGVSLSGDIMTSKENNFLAAIYFGKKSVGVSFLDITTGEYYVAEGDDTYIKKLLGAFNPKELLYERGSKERLLTTYGNKYYIYHLDEWIFSSDNCERKLMSQLEVTTLNGYGIGGLDNGIKAAGAILYYLEQTEHRQIKHINSIHKINEDSYVWLDAFSLRNLEIFDSSSPNGKSLFSVIDNTSTAMGSRTLRRWLSLPLRDKKAIDERLNVVDYLVSNETLSYNLRNTLREVCDIEKLLSKVATLRVNPQELLTIARTMRSIEYVKEMIEDSDNEKLNIWGTEIDICEKMVAKLEKYILPTAPNNVAKGGYIAGGVDLELDSLRQIFTGGKEYLSKIKEREIELTGISSLKIGFNNVFGYYLEVTNAHKDKVPAEWTRKQTLTGSERYITEELKEYEEKILGAEEKIVAIENYIYGSLLIELSAYLATMQADANIIGQLDTILSFSVLGTTLPYTRPIITEDNSLTIESGRHPIIENSMPLGEKYIPNDLFLNDSDQQIMIITGPNMSGKSAILRQTAIIVIMAQMGCYVPAKKATIGLIDRIFTRVGASDNISQGESTFMVEMLEAANILNNLNNRTLVLLDEIGRGTSTYDGISIAWAMVEYLHQSVGKRAKTLFATHYHELNEMENIYERVKNYNVQIKEINDKIVFMRKLVRGGTEHSFGIHVAKMAGMPRYVTDRAEEVLKSLEDMRAKSNADTSQIGARSDEAEKVKQYKVGEEKIKSDNIQLSLFEFDDPLVDSIRVELKSVDINNLTPLEALNKLDKLKRLIGIK